MSELRDLTAGMRAIASSQSMMQECLLVLLRNSEQQADWRHEQRNTAQKELGFREAQESGLKQVQEWMGDFSRKLGEVVERLDNYGATRQDDARRIGKLENSAAPEEEKTQP